MALGQRRAAIAKRYLTDHGVDASRIDIISYGKERPMAQGNDESAWAKNRNDQFEIVAGPQELKTSCGKRGIGLRGLGRASTKAGPSHGTQ